MLRSLNKASFSNDVMFYDASFFKDPLHNMISRSLKHASFFKDPLQIMSRSLKHPKAYNSHNCMYPNTINEMHPCKLFINITFICFLYYVYDQIDC